MSVLSHLTGIFSPVFESLDLPAELGAVTPSNRPELGQFQCNGALPAAKIAGRNPREIAQQVVDAVADNPAFESLELAGPGFINITLADAYLGDTIRSLAGDSQHGALRSESKRVLVDFGGPNVAKAMHAGHLRSTVIGDSLQRIGRFIGHDIVSDIHFGDWGTQMGKLIMEMERLQPELPYFDETAVEFPSMPPATLDDLQIMYPAADARCSEDPDELKKAQQATKELQDGRLGYRALWKHFATVSQDSQKRDFDDLGVVFDLWHGESTVADRVQPLVDRLTASGVAVRDQGALVIHVAQESDKADIPPLLLEKSDGAAMYGTTDIATLEERIQDIKAEEILYVVDERQALHFVQVFRAAALGGVTSDEIIEHIGFGTMNGTDAKPFKTRSGGVLRLRDLINMMTEVAAVRVETTLAADLPADRKAAVARQIGLAALKFGDLINHRSSNYIFDLDRFMAFEGKTGPYLQYSAVRMASILRRAADQGLAPGKLLDPIVEQERALILKLASLPEVVQRAWDLRAPNSVSELAFELAQTFNRFFEACHILSEPDAARQASWLELVEVTRGTLTTLLGLLGIEVPERM
jgi:arginyl-tRNA synthetase